MEKPLQRFLEEAQLFAGIGEFEVQISVPVSIQGTPVLGFSFFKKDDDTLQSVIYEDYTVENVRLAKALFPEFREYAVETKTE